VRGKHHQRSDDEGSNTADPERAESADMSLRHHEDDAEKHQRSAGIVDWHEGQRVKRDKKTDRADQPWRHCARIEKFEDQPVYADEQ